MSYTGIFWRIELFSLYVHVHSADGLYIVEIIIILLINFQFSACLIKHCSFNYSTCLIFDSILLASMLLNSSYGICLAFVNFSCKSILFSLEYVLYAFCADILSLHILLSLEIILSRVFVLIRRFRILS